MFFEKPLSTVKVQKVLAYRQTDKRQNIKIYGTNFNKFCTYYLSYSHAKIRNK